MMWLIWRVALPPPRISTRDIGPASTSRAGWRYFGAAVTERQIAIGFGGDREARADRQIQRVGQAVEDVRPRADLRHSPREDATEQRPPSSTMASSLSAGLSRQRSPGASRRASKPRY